MNKFKLHLYLTFILLVVLLISSCAPVSHYDFAAMGNAMKNWEDNRAKINMTKKQINDYFEKNYQNVDPIEGIWLYSFSSELSTESSNNPSNNAGMEDTKKNVWKVAIIKDLENPYAEKYIEVLFEPLGENSGYSDKDVGIILSYFKADLFPNNYIRETPVGPKEVYPNFKYTKTSTAKDNIVYSIHKYRLENNMLHSKQDTQHSGLRLKMEYLYTKVPFTFEEVHRPNETFSNTEQFGSGSLISETGLIVTNYHVVEDKSDFVVYFPNFNKEYNADLVMKDRNNDLALLGLQDFVYTDVFIQTIPFTITSSSNSKLGEDVFTLGFPLGEILGKSPKFSSGKINSLFGIQDDPRVFQISNPIQPGNSGGPLFNSNGEFIGVVFSSLNAKFFYENADILTQNVNFAVKSNYLLNIISLLPDEKEINSRENLLLNIPIEKQI